ncbi:hypothetical protein C8R43DRAFT_830219, partial [Mycena crocata]
DISARQEQKTRDLAALKAIISSIRRIPPEILAEIFLFCVDPVKLRSDYSIDSPRQPPLLLCHVCALWRAVAVNTPRLW